jgi:hypothetical protein
MPDDATERLPRDSNRPATEAGAGVASHEFLAAIDSALLVDTATRPQTIDEWRIALLAARPIQPAISSASPPSQAIEPHDVSSRLGPMLAVVAGCVIVVACMVAVSVAFMREDTFRAQQAPISAPAIATDVGPPPSSSALSDGAKARAAREMEIRGLLDAAAEDIAASRLTTPEGSNALEKLALVLRHEPGNSEAAAGLRHLSDEYLRLFNAALARKDWGNAETYIDRMRVLQIDSSEPSDAQRRLSAAISAEDSAVRDSTPSPQPTPVPSITAARARTATPPDEPLSDPAAGTVKKTSSGVCLAPGHPQYDATGPYTLYSRVEGCLNSGGRLPQRVETVVPTAVAYGAVKKNRDGVCFAQGHPQYEATNLATLYRRVEDCINSGGKLPK